MQKSIIKGALFLLMLATSFHVLETYFVKAAQAPDFKALIVEWVRPEGGYIIRLKDIKPDGSIDISYYNAKKINIAEANVSEWKGVKKLFSS
jgi:hypothetical protein